MPTAAEKLRAVTTETQLQQQAVRDTMLQNAAMTSEIEALHRLLESAKMEVVSTTKQIESEKQKQVIQRFCQEQDQATRDQVRLSLVSDLLKRKHPGLAADDAAPAAAAAPKTVVTVAPRATTSVPDIASEMTNNKDQHQQYLASLMRRRISIPELSKVCDAAQLATRQATKDREQAQLTLEKLRDYRASVETTMSKLLTKNEQLAIDLQHLKKAVTAQSQKALDFVASQRPLEKKIDAARKLIVLHQHQQTEIDKANEKALSREKRFLADLQRLQSERVRIRKQVVSESQGAEEKQVVIDELRRENQKLVQWLCDDQAYLLPDRKRGGGDADPMAADRQEGETAATSCHGIDREDTFTALSPVDGRLDGSATPSAPTTATVKAAEDADTLRHLVHIRAEERHRTKAASRAACEERLFHELHDVIHDLS